MDYDIKRILEAIPHRHPMLLVDRVTELVPGERIVSFKSVSFNEDFFRGHFPGDPVMPGVLILEAMAQSGGVLLVETYPKQRGMRPYLVGVDRVRFRRPVVPGDRLVLDVEMIQSRGEYHRFKAKAHVDDNKVAEAQLMLAVMVD